MLRTPSRTRRLLGLATVLVACACVAPATAAAAGRVTVASTPTLYPPFKAGAPDYAVRCDPATPVELRFNARDGAHVAVNGGRSRGGQFTASVKLKPGRALRFKVDAGPAKGGYHVRCVPPDFPDWSANRTGSPQARWYVVTPTILEHAESGYAVVFDRNGAPVWWMRDSHGSPFAGTLLPDGGIAWFPYQGTPFAIDKLKFTEHALDGSVVRRYGAVGTLTDHHELQVLPNRHAVVISYKPRDHVDLRPLNPSLPSDATVVDGVVQEVDRHGHVVWSWSTWRHIELPESSRWYRVQPVRLRDGRMAYDIVHLNSVDVHGKRVVISTRHTDAVYAIDKDTKNIVWKLGGTTTPQSLSFLDDPFGDHSFGGQHDARTDADGTRLTLFDNGTLRGRPPRAAEYAIDPVAKTARLLQSVGDPDVPDSLCCGSARLLPGGDWVVSWGGKALVTEADAAGKRVFALHLGHRIQSYRVFPILPSQQSAGKLRAGMDSQAP